MLQEMGLRFFMYMHYNLSLFRAFSSSLVPSLSLARWVGCCCDDPLSIIISKDIENVTARFKRIVLVCAASLCSPLTTQFSVQTVFFFCCSSLFSTSTTTTTAMTTDCISLRVYFFPLFLSCCCCCFSFCLFVLLIISAFHILLRLVKICSLNFNLVACSSSQSDLIHRMSKARNGHLVLPHYNIFCCCCCCAG